MAKPVDDAPSRDEGRHGSARPRHTKKYLAERGDGARRTGEALHPANVHLNEALYARDTVQSRLLDPH